MIIKDIEPRIEEYNKIHNEVIQLLELNELPKEGEPFYDLIKRENSKLKPILKVYYDKIKGKKKKLLINYLKQNPTTLCLSKDFPDKILNYMDNSTKEQLNILEKLYRYFFEDVLGKKGILKEHYDVLQLKICPFCTIGSFTSYKGKYRESYDHFLPITKYPYWGIDIRNLAPMCTVCNSYVKNSKDPFYSKENNEKQPILHPYQTLTSIKVILKAFDDEPIFDITAESLDYQIYLDNYVIFFELDERFKAEFKSRHAEWFEYLRENIFTQFKDVKITFDDYKTLVTTFIRDAEKRKNADLAKILEKAFFEFILINNSFYQSFI